MLSRHAGGGQRGAWHVVLAARGADRKTAADGIRAVIDQLSRALDQRAEEARTLASPAPLPAISNTLCELDHTPVRVIGL